MTHYPIEIQPPDIACYRSGNAGVDYVHVFDSGRAGPIVMVQALTHGNEFCGALALDTLMREGIRPAAGRLILAFANVEAFARFDLDDPDASRYIDEDYNRVWADDALFGPRDSVELRRARELRPFVDAADFLLDIHSMHEPCRPIMVCGMINKHVALARKVGLPADLLVDTGHPAGLRMRDRGSFNDPESRRSSLLIECGQHWERAAPAVALDCTLRFLAHFGLLSRDETRARLGDVRPAEQRAIAVTHVVTIASETFSFAMPVRGLMVVPKAGTLLATDDGRDVRTPHDDCVLIMPTRRPKVGETAVRLGRFVD